MRQLTPGVVCSLVLAVVMMAVFCRAAAGMDSSLRIYAMESRAILVMDITVTRLRAMGNYDAGIVERVFLEEFAASQLDGAEKKILPAKNSICLSITCQDGTRSRQLAAVEIKCQP